MHVKMIWSVDAERPASPSLIRFSKACKRCNFFLPKDQFPGRWKIEKGTRKFRLEARCVPCHAASRSEYVRDPDVKAARNVYRQSDHVVEQEREYRQSEAGKKSLKKRKKKYYGSATWRAQQDNENTRRRERYAESAAKRLDVCLSNVVRKMLKGTRSTSRTLYSYTEFADAEDFVAHMATRVREGMTMENYGEVWHVEHRIAKCWFSDDPEDVRRCWSYANIDAEFGEENLKKSCKIIDHLCVEVGQQYWPLSWNGRLPTAEEKIGMYRAKHQLVN